MRIFLDPATRVYRGVAPDGAVTLPDELTNGAIEFPVSDADWDNTYYPAWLSAQQTGDDLVVNVDGDPGVVPHQLSTEEQTNTAQLATLRAFASAPPDDVTSNALATLIRYLKLDQ